MESKLRFINQGERIMWTLLVVMFSLFSINSTNVNGIYALMAISIIAVCVLISSYNITRKICFDAFQKYLLLLSSYCFISTLWAENASDATEKGITLVLIMTCFSVFYYYFKDTEDVTSKLLKALLWGGYILVFYSFYYYGLNGVMSQLSSGYRLGSEFDNVNTIGLVCSITLIVTAHYIINEKFKLHYLMSIPTLLLLSATGSRTALISCIFGVCMIVAYRYAKGGFVSSFFKIVLSIVIMLLLVYLISQLPLFSGINQRMQGLISLISGKGEVDRSSQLRESYKLLGLEIFSEHPLVGIGIGNSHIYTYRYYGHDCYLHNNYVEMLANGGVVGFILYYSIYIHIFKTIIKNKLYNSSVGKLMIVIVCVMLLTDYGNVSYYSKVSYFILMIVLLYIQECNIISNEENPSSCTRWF